MESSNSNSDFFFTKGTINSLLEKIGIKDYVISPTKNDALSEGLSYTSNKLNVVEYGVVNPKILKEFGINQEVIFADFNWNNVLKLAQRKAIKYTPTPKFPEVKRDFALLLDNKTTFEEISAIASKQKKNF